MKKPIVIILSMLMVACSSGTIVTEGDNSRNPVIDNWENVAFYYMPPAHYEVIGVVTGKGKGFGDQSKMENAVEGIKEEALDAGATGVLLQTSGLASAGSVNIASATVNGGAVFGVGQSIPVVQGEITGQAIYVPEDAAAFIKAKAAHEARCDALDAKKDSMEDAVTAAKKTDKAAAEKNLDDVKDERDNEHCHRSAWYADQMQDKQQLMDKMRTEDQAAQDKEKEAANADHDAQCLAAAKANDLATWRKLECK
jgi:hypothetical protein